MTTEVPGLTAVPWRTGRSLGRTVYARTGGDWKADTVIGMLDTRELAEAACAAHNADLVRRAAGEAPGGCHEHHAYRKDHDPEACEALMLAGNLACLTGKNIGVTITPYITYPDGPKISYEVLLADDEGEEIADFQGQPSIAAGLAEARKWAEGTGEAP
jgi:hypothetical protein